MMINLQTRRAREGFLSQTKQKGMCTLKQRSKTGAIERPNPPVKQNIQEYNLIR